MPDLNKPGESATRNPYQPPKSQLIERIDSLIMQKGKYIVLYPDAEWPSRCIKCNSAASTKKKLTLAYVNPWIYLSILISILLTLILGLIFQKRFKLSIPLCESHRARRIKSIVINWILLLLIIGLCVVGIVNKLDMLLIIGFTLLIVLVILVSVTRLAYIAKYRDNRLWIKGAGKPFRDSLPEYN